MNRRTLPDSERRPLYFARVWEDPLLELEAFSPRPGQTYVVVGSGGCTALSMIAAGAQRVVAVDLNATQNDMGELKAALLQHCAPDEAIAFLGHAPSSRAARLATYRRIRPTLSLRAARHWDTERRAIGSGIERSGQTERATRTLGLLIRALVHPRRRIECLLAQPTLEAQRDYYSRAWNSRRWRWLLAILGSRAIFRLAYPLSRYHTEPRSDFASFYRRVFEHAVTALPVANNYFLHQVLLGRYPSVDVPDALPPYLAQSVLPQLRSNLDGLSFVDGTFTAYLRRCAPCSIDGFALSNICEWMTVEAVADLFSEIVRTATPSAVVCFRNNFGHTEVPHEWRHRVVEDAARSAEMSRRDRSIVTPRFAVCRVVAERARLDPGSRRHGPGSIQTS